MTSVVHARGGAALRRAAVRASLDPSGRQLTISCGAALLNARMSLAASGFDMQVDRFPDPRNRALVATLTLKGDAHPRVHSRVSLASPAALSVLDPFVDTRHTNRRAFTSDDVPDEVIAVLGRAVDAEQGEFFVVRTPEHRAAVASSSERAQAELDADPSYRSEALSWGRGSAQTSSSRLVPSGQYRDNGGELATGHCLLIVGSPDDSPLGWLRSGEALERMLVETTRQGFVAGPVAQTIVTAADRAALGTALGLTMTPQVVIRVGRAPVSPASRRRRLVDLLVEDA